MIDKSINFGTQNFLFVKADDAGETYDYVGYMTKKGSILLARYAKDGNSAGYCLIAGDFDTIWASKGEKTYGYPNTLVDPTI